jgi:hypothetical protein
LSGQVWRDEPRHGGVVCLTHKVNNWIEMNDDSRLTAVSCLTAWLRWIRGIGFSA